MFTKNGTIDGVSLGPESNDHGIPSFWLYVRFNSFSQGFGGIYLPNDEAQDDIVTELLRAFNLTRTGSAASDIQRLKGLYCVAGWCFERGRIEGIGASVEQMFVMYLWRRKIDPTTLDPFAEKREDLRSAIANNRTWIANAESELARLESLYSGPVRRPDGSWWTP